MLKLMLKLMLKAMLDAMLKLKAMLKAMLTLMLMAALKLMLKAMPKAMLKAKLKAMLKVMLKHDCPPNLISHQYVASPTTPKEPQEGEASQSVRQPGASAQAGQPSQTARASGGIKQRLLDMVRIQMQKKRVNFIDVWMTGVLKAMLRLS